MALKSKWEKGKMEEVGEETVEWMGDWREKGAKGTQSGMDVHCL